MVSPLSSIHSPKRRIYGQGNHQYLSASPYRNRLRRSINGDESPRASVLNSPLKELTEKEILEELLAYNFDSPPKPFRTSYQTPNRRAIPALTPLRVRRMRKKIYLIQDCDLSYGVLRLFKEEIFAIDNHPATPSHAGKKVGKNALDFGI